MIAQLIVGGIVVYPAFYWHPPLSLQGLACCIVFAVLVGVCVPDSWHE
jgi:hypothetical protein